MVAFVLRYRKIYAGTMCRIVLVLMVAGLDIELSLHVSELTVCIDSCRHRKEEKKEYEKSCSKVESKKCFKRRTGQLGVIMLR